MELPFFLVAHGYEKWRGLPALGYSDTYDNVIKASSLFYAILGSVLIFLVLKRRFTLTQSSITVLLIFSCTNLFWFTVFQAGMAHVPLYFLYALLVWLTLRLYEKQSNILFICCGLVAGVITLIRPTDILCLLIPILFNVYDRETAKARIGFLKEHKMQLLLFAMAFMVPIMPQLLYWKMITGSYVYYSYGDQSFSWSDPKIIEGLFYFSNGWFPYSPIMLFSIVGLFFYKAIRQWDY